MPIYITIMVSSAFIKYSCVFIFCIIFGCALPIAELVIGGKFDNDPSNYCNNGQLLKPTQWLIVDGSINLILCIIIIPAFITSNL